VLAPRNLVLQLISQHTPSAARCDSDAMHRVNTNRLQLALSQGLFIPLLGSPGGTGSERAISPLLHLVFCFIVLLGKKQNRRLLVRSREGR